MADATYRDGEREEEEAQHLHAEATSLIDGREEAEEDRAHQRQEICELKEDIADYQSENAQLKAELQLLKSETASICKQLVQSGRSQYELEHFQRLSCLH